MVALVQYCEVGLKSDSLNKSSEGPQLYERLMTSLCGFCKDENPATQSTVTPREMLNFKTVD